VVQARYQDRPAFLAGALIVVATTGCAQVNPGDRASVQPMPILYSFRRCPFAIRARMALVCAGIEVELREVKLGDFPQDMLRLAPKATVPVLVLVGGGVIDESLEVMRWALAQADPQQWLSLDAAAWQLIRRCDEDFKPLLDRYKYADRYPGCSQLEQRTRAESFVRELDRLLGQQQFLSGDRCRLVDVAIFPFVRQFAGVDAPWFERCEYAALRSWLNALLGSELFRRVMNRHSFWQPGDAGVYL